MNFKNLFTLIVLMYLILRNKSYCQQQGVYCVYWHTNTSSLRLEKVWDVACPPEKQITYTTKATEAAYSLDRT